MSSVSMEDITKNLNSVDSGIPPWASIIIDSTKAILSQLININGLLEKVNNLESEVSLSKTVSDRLFTDNKKLRNEQNELSSRVDNNEQRNRNMCLLIHGITESNDENTDNKVTEVIKNEIGIEFTINDIQRSHRLGRKDFRRKLRSGTEKPRPIIFRFVSYRKRDEVFKNKRKLKGKPFVISENITRYNYLLYKEAVDKIGKGKVWTNEGRITTKVGINYVSFKSTRDIDAFLHS